MVQRGSTPIPLLAGARPLPLPARNPSTTTNLLPMNLLPYPVAGHLRSEVRWLLNIVDPLASRQNEQEPSRHIWSIAVTLDFASIVNRIMNGKGIKIAVKIAALCHRCVCIRLWTCERGMAFGCIRFHNVPLNRPSESSSTHHMHSTGFQCTRSQLTPPQSFRAKRRSNVLVVKLAWPFYKMSNGKQET